MNSLGQSTSLTQNDIATSSIGLSSNPLPIPFSSIELFKEILLTLSYREISLLQQISQEFRQRILSIIENPCCLEKIFSVVKKALEIHDDFLLLSEITLNKNLLQKKGSLLHQKALPGYDFQLFSSGNCVMVDFKDLNDKSRAFITSSDFLPEPIVHCDSNYHDIISEGTSLTVINRFFPDSSIRYTYNVEKKSLLQEVDTEIESSFIPIKSNSQGMHSFLKISLQNPTPTLIFVNPTTLKTESYLLFYPPSVQAVVPLSCLVHTKKYYAVSSGLFVVLKRSHDRSFFFLRKSDESSSLFSDEEKWQHFPDVGPNQIPSQTHFAFTDTALRFISLSYNTRVLVHSWNYRDGSRNSSHFTFANTTFKSLIDVIPLGNDVAILFQSRSSLSILLYNGDRGSFQEKVISPPNSWIKAVTSFSSEKSRIIIQTKEEVIKDETLYFSARTYILTLLPILTVVSFEGGIYNNGFFHSLEEDPSDTAARQWKINSFRSFHKGE